MNQQNQKPKSPNSGPEMRQLIFLAVILAALLILVLGGFAVVQVVDQLVNQSHTPPITEQPGNNPIETVPGEQQEDPEEDPSWWDSLWAGIVDLFSPVDGPNTPGGNPTPEPDPTYPFSGNTLAGSALPAGNGDVLPDTATYSKYAILVNAADGTVLASELADERMYPASMTKVMTLVVIVENLKHEWSLQDRIKLTPEVQEEMQKKLSSGPLKLGKYEGDELCVESMLYAIALESDGVACIEMAKYIAGSEQAFVELMNQKARELGLTGTHFVNTHGLHDDDHYTTARDMAAIMRYAMQNELCAKVLSTDQYTAVAYYLKDGQPAAFNHYFKHTYLTGALQNYPAYATKMPIVAAKTGLTDEAKSCFVSYMLDQDGNAYVCVTGYAGKQLEYLEDHSALYNKYAK